MTPGISPVPKTKKAGSTAASNLLRVMRDRRSARVRFDPHRRVEARSLKMIIEAARWAPTPHNMQNFEIVIVDDAKLLRELGRIRSRPSEEFLNENYQQLSFSEEELLLKRVGLFGAQFPPSWRNPAKFREVAHEGAGEPLSRIINGSPTLLVVTYDPRRRAPASEGDALGFMGLGCVMENIWLMAYSLQVGLHIVSVFGREPEKEVKRILRVPKEVRIAYAVRLGYPVNPPAEHHRVRRETRVLTHHNRYNDND
jgi:nitroreductase